MPASFSKRYRYRNGGRLFPSARLTTRPYNWISTHYETPRIFLKVYAHVMWRKTRPNWMRLYSKSGHVYKHGSRKGRADSMYMTIPMMYMACPSLSVNRVSDVTRRFMAMYRTWWPSRIYARYAKSCILTILVLFGTWGSDLVYFRPLQITLSKPHPRCSESRPRTM